MGAWRLEIDDNIAILTLNMTGEKVNKLSTSILEELDSRLDEVIKVDVHTLVIRSSKPAIFIAGADVKEFEVAFESKECALKLLKRGQDVFTKIASLDCKTVALIQGACMGGGLELALACDCRIVTDHPKTLLALPEVNLGIIPGWGGTQRLPRIIGLQPAIKMIASGRGVKAKKAYKIGLADAILPWEFTDLLLRKTIGEIKKKPVKQAPFYSPIIFYFAKKMILKTTRGHYPAPLIALEVMRRTTKKIDYKHEREAFTQHLFSGQSLAKPLIELFFGLESLKKGESSRMKRIGVLGAGTMGSEIAWMNAKKGLNVRLKDVKPDSVARGLKHIKSLGDPGNISWTTDNIGMNNCELIIEAVPENLKLKQQLFAELDSTGAILATNTSSLRVSDIAAKCKHPEKVVGMHFFNPVSKMPLVEIVRGDKTSPETLEKACALALKMGKKPIVVGDCHGFLVNRIFGREAQAILTLLSEGVPYKQLKKVVLKYGMPMDFLSLADMVGNDVNLKVLKVFEQAYGKRFKAPDLLQQVVDSEFLGDKVGRGFYINGKPNPEILKLLPKEKPVPDQLIWDTLEGAILDESCRCLEERIIDTPENLKLALVLGLGFPPFREVV